MIDTRNVLDEFKDMPHDEIVGRLDENGIDLEIAIENLARDYNMGTIVRSANAFGVRKIHVIGSRQWNKRGAMMTDKYLEIIYHKTIDEFIDAMRSANRNIISIDNTEDSSKLNDSNMPRRCVLVFGAEGPGISDELMQKSDAVIAIEQFGSTRSVNVGVAAGIVMYEWLRRNFL
jgi:tRNA G18 (ribose-2'-O)-methylase SpoU